MASTFTVSGLLQGPVACADAWIAKRTEIPAPKKQELTLAQEEIIELLSQGHSQNHISRMLKKGSNATIQRALRAYRTIHGCNPPEMRVTKAGGARTRKKPVPKSKRRNPIR